MAVGAAGDLYVAHFRADRVQRFRSDGLYLEELRGLTGSDSSLAAMGIGADPDGSLWVASLARRGLLHLDRDLRELGVITPTRLSPSAVTGIAVARDGTLVLAESAAGGIERLSRDGRSLLGWGGQRSRSNPEDYGYCRNYDVIGVSCAAQPVAVARDGRTIFLLDGSKGRVQRYTMDGERLEPWTGLAQESEIRRTAQALTVAADGSLYVADTGAGEVVRFSNAGAAIERLGGAEDASAPFDRPVALAADADDMLYVADIPAGRVLALGADAVDAWRGEYFVGPWPIEHARAIQHVPELDLRWGEDAPDPALDSGGWSARFTRELSLSPGSHRFGLRAEGGVRLWLGDRLAVDAWHAPHAQWIVQAEAPPDGVLEVRVEYRSGRDTAALSLVVDDPSLPTVTAIPTRVPTAGPTSTPTATTTPSGQPSERIHLPVLQAR
jgi:sugar lactone lactonase YvrE